MENYKKKLQNRMNSYLAILSSLSIFFIVGQQGYLSKFYPEGDFGDFFRGFHLGLYIAFALFMIAYVARIGVILKDSDKLKADYIKNTDERNIRISELTGYNLYLTLIVPFFVAVIVAGYFSSTVFLTLLAVIVFISVVTYAKWAYYNKTI